MPSSTSKFHPSKSVCENCTRLLTGTFGVFSLLFGSFQLLDRSARHCPLCRLIRCGLLGREIAATGQGDVRGECQLLNLIQDTEPPARIWARRYSAAAGLAESTYPKSRSLPEIIMAKGAPNVGMHHGSVEDELGWISAWGLKHDLNINSESVYCPYDTEFKSLQPGSKVSMSGSGFNVMLANYQSCVLGIAIKPYHRAFIDVCTISNNVCDIVHKIYSDVGHPSVGSENRRQLGRYWLENCQQNHSNCNRWKSQTTFMPTRLIDVGPYDGSHGIRLVEAMEKGIPEDYVCLSHRWGGSKALMTTKGCPAMAGKEEILLTYEKFKESIPSTELPKTFLQAVEMTRFLGYRYLWIDSLCIIQDQEEDWRTEAKRMGDVYRNGAITLVAAAATSADSGLFSDLKEPRASPPCQIGTVELERKCERHPSHSFNIFAHEVRKVKTGFRQDKFSPYSSLSSRAWVLQEEVLSTRCLIFTEEGIYWECVDLEASETLPDGSEGSHTKFSLAEQLIFYPSRMGYARNFKLALLSHNNDLPDDNTSSENHFYLHYKNNETLGSGLSDDPFGEGLSDNLFAFSNTTPVLAQCWRDLVENCSARCLTFESDRIIAIQGLANVIKQFRPDEIHAGLWRSTLKRELLWAVSETQTVVEHHCGCLVDDQTRHIRVTRPRREATKRPSSFLSWSWACINQKVTCMAKKSDAQYFFDIVNVDTTETKDGVTGRLTIKGLLEPVIAIVETRMLGKQGMIEKVSDICGKICHAQDTTLKSIGQFQVDEDTELRQRAFRLPVTWADDDTILCLILEPTERSRFKTPGSNIWEFRRIGIASCRLEDRSIPRMASPIADVPSNMTSAVIMDSQQKKSRNQRIIKFDII
ncbi:heterokaryon incompatibility protein-domain-containing protein [Xylaria cf. heliscus]|nr:heterokaryon incompatibility protein-domain-containing protein [Xylaria cf. heliscus]